MAKRPGAAFTGQDVPDENAPLQDIVGGARNVASSANQALLGDPASRSALLQIGLGLMTPSFSSTGGRIAQAVGGGGEAISRIEAEDLARKKQEDELDKTDRTLAIRQQEADAYSKGMSLKTLIDRQALQSQAEEFKRSQLGTKNYASHAQEIFKTVTGPAFDSKNPTNAPFKRFEGKDSSEIEDMLRSEGAARKGPDTTAAPTTSGAVPVPKSKDDEARSWATANPNDPRAAEIRRRLGM